MFSKQPAFPLPGGFEVVPRPPPRAVQRRPSAVHRIHSDVPRGGGRPPRPTEPGPAAVPRDPCTKGGAGVKPGACMSPHRCARRSHLSDGRELTRAGGTGPGTLKLPSEVRPAAGRVHPGQWSDGPGAIAARLASPGLVPLALSLHGGHPTGLRPGYGAPWAEIGRSPALRHGSSSCNSIDPLTEQARSGSRGRLTFRGRARCEAARQCQRAFRSSACGFQRVGRRAAGGGLRAAERLSDRSEVAVGRLHLRADPGYPPRRAETLRCGDPARGASRCNGPRARCRCFT